jgi:hypothetical protein
MSMHDVRKTVATLVSGFAAKFDEIFSQDLDKIGDANEVKKGAPVMVLEDLIRMFGDGIFNLPRAGIVWSEGINVPYDLYPYVDDNGKDAEGSVLKDLTEKFPRVIAWRKVIADVKAAKSGKADAPEEYKSMDDTQQSAVINRYDQRIKNARAATISAVRLFWQMDDIDEQLPLVRCQFAKHDNGDRMNTPNPMHLYAVDEKGHPTGKAKLLSVTTFLTLKVSKAKEKDGTLADLLATAGKAKKKDADKTRYPVIENAGHLDDWASTGATYFDVKDPGARLMAALNAKDTDDLCLSVGRLKDVIEGVWHHYENRYNRLLQAQAAAIEATDTANNTAGGNKAAA